MPPICRSCRSSWSTANGSAGGNCCPTRASSVASSLGNEERHQLGDLLGPSWTPDGNSSQGLHDDVTRGLFTNSPQPTSIWTKAKEASQGFVQTVDQRIRGGSVQEDAAAFQPLLADYSVLRAASSITFATARGCDRNGTWLDFTSVTCALAR